MNTESIKKELISLVATLFADNGFDVDMIEYIDFIDDLGMDSITFISLVVELEAKFDIIVPDKMLTIENFKSIDDILVKIFGINKDIIYNCP